MNGERRRAQKDRGRGPFAAVLALAAGLLGTAAGGAPEPPVLPGDEVIDGHPVADVLAPDQIRALDQPPLVPAAQARGLADDEPVLGVVIGGEARAYSLRLLDWHEVVNDRIRGRPIAVTW